jgi:hypothetical protein
VIRKALALALLAFMGLAAAESFDTGGFDTGGFSDGSFLFDGAAPTATVPDCTTAPTAQAACEALVTGEGLVPSVVARCSGTVANGNVVSTAPPEGEEVSAGSTVTIRVSTGVACVTSDGTGQRLGIGIGISLN